MEFSGLKTGTLVARRQRFFMDILTDSGPLTIHCPNTGSMAGLLEPDLKVWWTPSQDPKRKLPGTAELLEFPTGHFALINTHRANAIVAEALAAQPDLLGSGTGLWKSEYPLGSGVRIDFGRPLSLADGATADLDKIECLEVKSVSWVESGLARFPDAASERARKQMQRMMEWVHLGHRAQILYFVARTDAVTVQLGHSRDPKYDALLKQSLEQGLGLKAKRLRVEVLGSHKIALSLDGDLEIS
jgi:sugar fermentation stimulation protein A